MILFLLVFSLNNFLCVQIYLRVLVANSNKYKKPVELYYVPIRYLSVVQLVVQCAKMRKIMI